MPKDFCLAGDVTRWAEPAKAARPKEDRGNEVSVDDSRISRPSGWMGGPQGNSGRQTLALFRDSLGKWPRAKRETSEGVVHENGVPATLAAG